MLGLMILTLLLSLTVNKDGAIEIRSNSLFYKTRFVCFLGFATLTATMKHFGEGAHYWDRNGKNYFKKVIMDARYMTEGETNLCKLFWSHILSFFFLIPLNIIVFSIALALVVSVGPVVGVIFAIAYIGIWFVNGTKFVFSWIGKSISKAIDKMKIEYDERLLKKYISKQQLEYNQSNLSEQEINLLNFKSKLMFDFNYNSDVKKQQMSKHSKISCYKELITWIDEKEHNRAISYIRFQWDLFRLVFKNIEYKEMQAIDTKKDANQFIQEKLIDTGYYMALKTLVEQYEIQEAARKKHDSEIEKIKREKREARMRKWKILNQFRKRWLCPTIEFKGKE